MFTRISKSADGVDKIKRYRLRYACDSCYGTSGLLMMAIKQLRENAEVIYLFPD